MDGGRSFVRRARAPRLYFLFYLFFVILFFHDRFVSVQTTPPFDKMARVSIPSPPRPPARLPACMWRPPSLAGFLLQLFLSLVDEAAELLKRPDPMAVVGEYASVIQALAALVERKPLAGLFARLPRCVFFFWGSGGGGEGFGRVKADQPWSDVWTPAFFFFTAITERAVRVSLVVFR